MTYTNIECDICEELKPCMTKYGNMKYCDECWIKEEASTKLHMSPEAQQARVDASDTFYKERDSYLALLKTSAGPIEAAIPINSVLRDSHIADHNIQVRTDLFNAATKSIIELRDAINTDESITNKPYALAEQLKGRYDHFKSLIFELNQKLVEAGNEQRAIQTYLNTMSNQLRAEEREKLKIADINYKPAPPKTIKVKTIKTSGTKKKTKLDKTALRNAASQLGVSEFTLQMLVTAKGITLDEAIVMLTKSIQDAKS